MDINKVNNLFMYLNDKYGEESVRLFRFCEFSIKKMGDYRNHKIFILRCIKVRVTLISYRLRNPLHVKTTKSYDIIHKAERQLLHEQVRNINRILYMYEHNRGTFYSQLRNIISEEDMTKCRDFIYKIKEHRYFKVKEDKSISSNVYYRKAVDTCITF